MSSEGYIGFDAFEEIMIQRYAAQDPMDEIRKAFDAWLAQVAGVWRLEEPGKNPRKAHTRFARCSICFVFF